MSVCGSPQGRDPYAGSVPGGIYSQTVLIKCFGQRLSLIDKGVVYYLRSQLEEPEVRIVEWWSMWKVVLLVLEVVGYWGKLNQSGSCGSF